jgi:hypothetical protein
MGESPDVGRPGAAHRGPHDEGGIMSTRTLRRLCGHTVRVRRSEGELSGTMLSVTPRSLWMLVDDEDVIVELVSVEEVWAA